MVGSGFGPEFSLSLSCGSGRDGCLEKSNNSPRIHRNVSVFGNIAPCQPQQITIFYNGQIRVFDVTEIQARDIISMAKQEMENSTAKNNLDQQEQCPTNHEYVASSSPPFSSHKAVVQKLFSPELSMKRSLQRFLQKRKSRNEAVSPYNYSRHNLPCLLDSSVHKLS